MAAETVESQTPMMAPEVGVDCVNDGILSESGSVGDAEELAEEDWLEAAAEILFPGLSS